MAKSDLRFDSIDFRRIRQRPGKPAFLKNTPINGFDTETADGRVFLLSYCYAGSKPKVLHNSGKPIPSETIFQKITSKSARASLNVWFNLDFDMNVILSVLPPERLYDITVFGHTEWEGYEITFIPGKLLSIKDKNKHVYNHFDIAQFFFQSLKKASASWLDETKVEGIDVKKFGLENGSVNKYIRENWDSIVHYAKEDARLTRNLWERFSQVAEDLGIPCGKPYSTGYLAEQTYNVRFRDHGKSGWAYHGMQKLAWAAYHGGRFEIIERGDIGSIITVDINSAYPNALRNLPDPSTLTWTREKSPSLKRLRSFDYGFLDVEVSTDPSAPIQPFAVKSGGSLKFPVLKKKRLALLLQEFLFAQKQGLITEYKIHDAWLAERTVFTRFPFRFIDALYAERQKLKAEGADKKQHVLKIILNSLYGKLAQLTDKTIEHSNSEPWRKDWIFYPLEIYPPSVRKYLGKDFRELHKEVVAGKYFNPFLASYITGLTRLQLLEAVYESGLENAVVMLATDSLTVQKGPFERSGFEKLLGKGLGNWEIESEGHAFIIGSGVYEIEKANGERHMRSRGFSSTFGVWGLDLKGISLREAAGQACFKDGMDTIPITHKRPLKIGQAVWQSLDFSRVGVFENWPKGISAGMDSKRIWPRGNGVTFTSLLKKSERSFPLTFED